MTASNTPDYLLAWFALMEVGAIQVPVNPQSTGVELDGFVAQVAPRASSSADAPNMAAAVRRDVRWSWARGRRFVRCSGDDPDLGHYRTFEAGHADPPRLRDGGRGVPVLDATHERRPTDDVVAVVPHQLACVHRARIGGRARASVVLLPTFSASGFLDSARRFGATEFNAIGAMLEILMRQPPRPDDADTPLRLCYTGPSPERERHEEIEARLGLQLVCGYALSESPYGLIWRHGTRPFGTLGSARQHPTLGHVNDARVVGGDGRELAAGAVGELELRNPVIMRGYFEMPAETAAALHDGWLRTGDLVQANDDETFTFLGRKKEVIRRRGENLSPVEVEAALEHHPDVAEAAVIGVPSELSEEDVKAFITVAPGASVDVAAVHALARERLAAFKVPRYIEVVDELPHTPTGRLAKHRLPVERTPGEMDFEVPA